ncbi:MAG: hypothetical protein PHC61_18890 [Chitinivibrionales bacterium]|nr:hypothetical protein [Chitinivibrionales bacterium]
MTLFFYCSNILSRFYAPLLILAACISFVNAYDADQVAKLADAVKAGPAIYYTPAAAASLAAQGNYSASGPALNKEAAGRALRATIKLGDLPQNQARAAIPALIDIFPKAVHVVEIRQATFSGRGSLDDCISTYVVSAKTQFMLAAPFLDYNSLALCENFIEDPYKTEIISQRKNSSGTVVEAFFNLRITFIFYAGECALARLTGLSLGHDPAAWRQWWQTSAGASSAGASVSDVNNAGGQSVAADFSVGGTYRVVLTTGDSLTGTVTSIGDSSMVLKTTGGKSYDFRYSLLQSYRTLQTAAPAPQAQPSFGLQIISYDDLKLRANASPQIEVKIANGSLFKGKLMEINDDGLKMDIEGSTVPVAKTKIVQIMTAPPEKP